MQYLGRNEHKMRNKRAHKNVPSINNNSAHANFTDTHSRTRQPNVDKWTFFCEFSTRCITYKLAYGRKSSHRSRKLWKIATPEQICARLYVHVRVHTVNKDYYEEIFIVELLHYFIRVMFSVLQLFPT